MVDQLSPSQEIAQEGNEDFYLRYYVGHKGKFGHEFLEFEFTHDGRLRYSNNSQYKAENLIRKEGTFLLSLMPSCVVYVSDIVLDELRTIIRESQLLKESDKQWPLPNKVGRQELEVCFDGKHKTF